MAKLPWQGKDTKADNKVFIPTKPGECISVDQMTSTEVGFYVPLKGKLTKKGYKCVTVFVDHFSCLCFVHLQLNKSSAETLATKLAFEQYVAEHGVKILHYHCDNGQFYNNAFCQACHKEQQHSPFVASEHTSNMALPSEPSVISQKPTQAVAPRTRLLAHGSPLHFVAICVAQHCTPPQ
jgi:hypothetical protein